jgi:hypothetical protein
MASRIAAMSRSSRSRSTAFTVCLLVESESGALAAMVAASFATVASSSATGTTRLTSPMRSASAAGKRSPVMRIMWAWAGPTRSTSERTMSKP